MANEYALIKQLNLPIRTAIFDCFQYDHRLRFGQNMRTKLNMSNRLEDAT